MSDNKLRECLQFPVSSPPPSLKHPALPLFPKCTSTLQLMKMMIKGKGREWFPCNACTSKSDPMSSEWINSWGSWLKVVIVSRVGVWFAQCNSVIFLLLSASSTTFETRNNCRIGSQARNPANLAPPSHPTYTSKKASIWMRFGCKPNTTDCW